MSNTETLTFYCIECGEPVEEVIYFRCGYCNSNLYTSHLIDVACPNCRRFLKHGEGGTIVKKVPWSEAINHSG